VLQKRCLDGVEIISVDYSRLIEALKKISAGIKKDHPEVKEIILFGSFSKDEYTPESDIDIAIILEYSDRSFIERGDEFIEYFASLPFDVNLVVYTSREIEKMIKDNNSFIMEILKGKRL